MANPLKGRAVGGSAGLADRAMVRRAFSLLVDPDHNVELRSLPSARSRVRWGHDLDALVQAAEDLADDRGVYYTLNPIDKTKLPAGADRAAKVGEVVRRRWLLVDVDPVRKAGTNATTGEKMQASLVCQSVREWLAHRGWPAPVEIDSGNGFHLLYRVDLPSDPVAQALLRECLLTLARVHDTDTAKIDRQVHNASRISKLPGTWARKGPRSPDRPWRVATILQAPETPQVVSLEQLEDLACRLCVPSSTDDTVVMSTTTPPPAQEAPPSSPPPGGRNPLRGKATSGPGMEDRAILYLAECDPAISGQSGHSTTLRVARAIVWGFGLGVERGLAILLDHYNPRCQPPWSERELRHKCEDAERTPDPSGRPRGYLLDEWVPSASSPPPGAAGSTPEAATPQQEQEWPEISVLPREYEAAPFPLEVLPESIRRFVVETAWALPACPVDFVAVPVLGVASGAIGGSRRVSITRAYSEPAALWCAVVGDPGSGKSPALSRVAQPFWDVHHERVARFKKQLEQHKEDRESVPHPGQLRRCIVQNTTTEALTSILAANPRGVLMHQDELRALFAGMDQYKAGGKGNDRQFYLSLWNTSPIVNDRKNDPDSAPVSVPRPYLSIVGGIQPATVPFLQAETKGDTPPDDGCIDRFLFSYPARLPAEGEKFREVSEEAERAWDFAIRELLGREMMVNEHGVHRAELVRLTESGRQAWRAWSQQHAAEINDPAFPEILRGPWSKLSGYCARLALVLYCLQQACGEPVDVDGIDGDTVRRAALLVAYFKSHHRLIVRNIREDSAWERARWILAWIGRESRTRSNPVTEFKRHEVYADIKDTRAITKPSALDEPLERLVEVNILRIRPAPRLGRPGRPSADMYEVHPGLLEMLPQILRPRPNLTDPNPNDEVEL